MLILVDPPQLGIGDVHIAREVLSQLDARNLIAINRLDLREHRAVTRGREELLPLADIELAVGLELRVARDLGGRRVSRHVDDLFVAHPNPKPLVLLPEQRVLSHLIDDLIAELLVFFT